MALPRLKNDVPRYEMTVPSTGEVVKYRPFLVKEQKVLLVAFETQDNKQILNSMLDCLSSCIPKIKLDELATFDVDYMFTQVRAKSVGETTTVLHACKNCNEENEVKIKLDTIKVSMPENWKKDVSVQISDDIAVDLKFPTYNDISYINANADTTETEVLMDTVAACIKAVKTDDEYLLIKDEPKEEVERFINSLTNTQLEKITSFATDAPKLSHTEKYECKKCKTENKIELNGLQDFF